MKKKLFKIVLLLLVVLFVFSACATVTRVPPQASEAQLNQINAQNIEATAINTSTLAGIQLASIIASLIVGLTVSGL